MTRIGVIGGCGLALFGCELVETGEERPEAGQQRPIWNGSTAPADDGVVAITVGEHVECTGILVAADTVLTAAHCVEEKVARRVLVGEDPGEPRLASDVIEVKVRNDADLALLRLAPPLEAIEPLALMPVAADGLTGAQVRVVGYGHSGEHGHDQHRRRATTSRIARIDAVMIETEPDPGQVCLGDSGGPALVVLDGREVVVGVASTAEIGCMGAARFTRVDAGGAETAGGMEAPTSAAGCGAAASAEKDARNRSSSWILLGALVALAKRSLQATRRGG